MDFQSGAVGLIPSLISHHKTEVSFNEMRLMGTTAVCHHMLLTLWALHIKNLITCIRYAGFDRNHFCPFVPFFVPCLNRIIMSPCWKSYSKNLFADVRKLLAKWRRWTDKTKRVPISIESLLFTLMTLDHLILLMSDASESSLLSLPLRGQNVRHVDGLFD